MGELAAPEHPVDLHKWAVSHGAGGFFSTFKLWGVEPHGAALEAWCAGPEQRRGMLVGYLGGFPMGLAAFAHQHMGFSLAALHWLWVPLRGSCPAGGNRQRLRFPAGAFQPPAQLPQPRVLPWEADVERGESGRRRADGLDGATSFTPGFGLAWEEQLLKGGFSVFGFFARFPPNAEMWIPAAGVPSPILASSPSKALGCKGPCCGFGLAKEKVVQETSADHKPHQPRSRHTPHPAPKPG